MKVHCIKFHVFLFWRKVHCIIQCLCSMLLHYALFIFHSFHAGFDEGAHQGGISLFETQVHTPTINNYVIEDPPVKHAKEPVSKRMRSAQSLVKPVKNAPSKRSRRTVSPSNA